MKDLKIMFKKFNEKYDKILSEIRITHVNGGLFKYEPRFYASESIYLDEIITEMNENVYPIPKELLSFLVKEVFENGFFYVKELPMNIIIEKIKESQNFKKIQFSLEKINKTKNKTLMIVCLPNNIDIWIKELKKTFSEEEIRKTFALFMNRHGAFGTYHSGFLILLNANSLKELKDVEEVIEHELIHLFETIDNVKHDLDLSFDLETILEHPSEYKTHIVNLLNRLEKVFNKCVIELNINNSNFDHYKEKFVKDIFSIPKFTKKPEEFIDFFKAYDNSPLLEESLYFLWYLVKSNFKELKEVKHKVFEHFSVEE